MTHPLTHPPNRANSPRCSLRALRSWTGVEIAVFCLLLATLLTLWVAPASGEEAEPRFFLDSVSVHGLTWGSESIVRSETHLVPGQSYSEAQLQAALFRVSRLPFVLRAEFSLLKGAEKGRYELSITVKETRRFFVSGDLSLAYSNDSFASTDSLPRFDNSFEVFPSVSLGTRRFVGTHGEFFAAVDSGGGLQLGARHYNLFGRGAVGTLLVRADFYCCGGGEVVPLALDPSFSWWLPHVFALTVNGQLTVPLGGHHSLTASVEEKGTDEGSRDKVAKPSNPLPVNFIDFGTERMRRRQVALGWQYDSTDDPLAPRRGSRFGAKVELIRLSAEVKSFRPDRSDDYKARYLRASLTAGHTHPLTLRHSLFVDGRLAFGRAELEQFIGRDGQGDGEVDALEASLRFGHRALLWAPRSMTTRPELWVETSLSVASEETFADRGKEFLESDLSNRTLESSLLLRTSWGVLRFSVSWVDWDGSGL